MLRDKNIKELSFSRELGGFQRPVKYKLDIRKQHKKQSRPHYKPISSGEKIDYFQETFLGVNELKQAAL